MIDIAIISAANTPDLKSITENAVRTLAEHTRNYRLIVVESAPGVTYKGAMMIRPKQPFNYNAYGNLALRNSNADFVGLFNNDVVFTPNWWDHLRTAMEAHKLDSASPLCPRSAEAEGLTTSAAVSIGYGIRRHVMGWAIVLRRKTYEAIGGFNEAHRFWCSDDVYADQLKAGGYRHGLVTASVVHHLESKTLKTVPEHLRGALTHEEKLKYQGK